VLEAINLKKTYGDYDALKGINLSVPAGRIVCLLGANGAGKTTTINLFLNFIDPTSGTAKVNGLEVTANPLETKKHLAYIPETVMLYGNLTGLENLTYFAKLGGHAEYKENDLRGFLKRVGLQDGAVDKRVAAYSKGMRQKVGVAIALAKRAKALLLDEPTSGLDPVSAAAFDALLLYLRSHLHLTVVMITHDLDSLFRTCDRVGVIVEKHMVTDTSVNGGISAG